MDGNRWLRFFAYLMVFVLSLTGLISMYGPRPHVELQTRFEPPADVGALDDWLAANEAKVPKVKPGLQKEIVWHDPVRRGKTPLSIVYIHGFSASKGEIRPVPDEIARALGANLFYTRLSGHGADGAALGAASAEQWLDDAAEALWIGSQIGDRTVVMGTSTGATLAVPLLLDPKFSDKVAATIFISPNFGLKATGSSLLTAPFAGFLAETIMGKERVIEPLNPAQAQFWTLRYPVQALLPMAALVKAVGAIDFGTIRTPAFFFYSRDDQVVDPAATDAVYAAWGGPKEKGMPGQIEDPYHHVIAGDALSPSGTAPAVAVLTHWLKTELKL